MAASFVYRSIFLINFIGTSMSLSLPDSYSLAGPRLALPACHPRAAAGILGSSRRHLGLGNF
jgi:hypothetical protein